MRAALATLVLVVFAQAASADAIDDYLARQMQQLRLPGLALAIVRGGAVESVRTYGKASLEDDRAVTRETVFELGSLTKQFTAVAVMMLAGEGRVRLDQSVTTYLPEVPKEWNAITVRHLLTHSSGLQEYLGVPGLADEAHALPHREMTQLFASRIRQEFPPGETWAYSNTGYLLLGDIIERTSGQSYWQFLRERIFVPAGMHATRSSDPRAEIPDRATGYGWQNGAFQKRPALSGNAYAAGSIVSTIDDMARWALALRANAPVPHRMRVQIWTPLTLRAGAVPPFPYGFGWVIDRERGERAVFHSGGTPGFSSAIRHYPELGITVVVLANHGDRILDHLPLEIAGMVAPRVARTEAADPDPRRSQQLADTLRAVMAGKTGPAAFTPPMQAFLTTTSGRGLGEWLASHGELSALRYAQTDRAATNRVLRYRATIGDAELWFSFTVTRRNEIAQIFWW